MIKTVISSRLTIILAVIALDILTGIIKGFSTKSYNSSIMRQGLWHKLAELIGVAFGYLCDYACPVIGVELPVKLSAAIIAYLFIMEASSIVENLGELSPTLGKYLSKYFEKVSGSEDEYRKS